MKSISDMNLAEVTLAILSAAANIPDGMYARAQYLATEEMRALLDKPVEEVDDEQWYADTPDMESVLVTRVGALTEWQKGRDGMRAERDAALSELSELKAAQHKGDPVGCRYRKTDRPDRCWTYCEGVKVTPWEGYEVQPLCAEQPASVAVFNPERALLERWAGLRGEISLDQVYEDARSLLEKPAPTAHTMRSVMEITQEASKYYVVGTSNWCAHIATRLNGVKP